MATSKPILKCTDDIIPNYEIINEGRAIKFTPCGLISHNEKDVRNYYCAHCHRFLNDTKLLKARLR